MWSDLLVESLISYKFEASNEDSETQLNKNCGMLLHKVGVVLETKIGKLDSYLNVGTGVPVQEKIEI